jgi:hypothetical protein
MFVVGVDLGTQSLKAVVCDDALKVRGELILLDHRERAGGLVEPAAIDRLLVLAAAYGFPCARASAPTPWAPPDGEELEYHVYIGPREITVHCRRAGRAGSSADARGPWLAIGCGLEIQLEERALWTDEQAGVILAIVGDALRESTPIGELCFPYDSPYEGPPLPSYPDAPRRVYALPSSFARPRGLRRDRHALAARDYDRWHALWARLQALADPLFDRSRVE